MMIKISDEKSEQISYSVSIIPVRRVNSEAASIDKVVRQNRFVKSATFLELFVQSLFNGIFSRCDAHVHPVRKRQINETNRVDKYRLLSSGSL
jgi:hypothetical protein